MNFLKSSILGPDFQMFAMGKEVQLQEIAPAQDVMFHALDLEEL